MADAIEGPVSYNWHIVDNVLVGLKVCYLSNFSAAPHFGERPESARFGHRAIVARARTVAPKLTLARAPSAVWKRPFETPLSLDIPGRCAGCRSSSLTPEVQLSPSPDRS